MKVLGGCAIVKYRGRVGSDPMALRYASVSVSSLIVEMMSINDCQIDIEVYRNGALSFSVLSGT